MLGLIQGVNTAVGREHDRRSLVHSQNVNLRSQFLDQVVDQTRFNADYNLRKTDLESVLQSRSVQRAATRQQMQQSADRHPREMLSLDLGNKLKDQTFNFNEQANPKRLEALDWSNKLSGQTFNFNEKANPKRLEALDWANKISGQTFGFNEKANPLRLEGLRLGNQNTQSMITARSAASARADQAAAEATERHGWDSEKHQEWKADAPLREINRENALQLGEWQGGEGMELYQKGERLKVLQSEADLAQTKARTQGLTSGSGTSAKPPVSYEQGKDIGKTNAFIDAFTEKQGLPLFKSYIPYDNPDGPSQKSMLSDHGVNVGRELRRQLPIGQMTIGDVRAQASARWQGMMESEKGETFREALTNKVPFDLQSDRIEAARQHFVDATLNEILNPTSSLTVDQMPAATQEIDPALLGQGEGWGGVLNPIKNDPDLYHTTPQGRKTIDPVQYIGRKVGEFMDKTGISLSPEEVEAQKEATRQRRATMWQTRGGLTTGEQPTTEQQNPLQGISPAETQPSPAVTLPANEQDRAMQLYQQTGEMDWDWFTSLPEEAQIRMLASLPDYKQQEFINDYDRTMFGQPLEFETDPNMRVRTRGNANVGRIYQEPIR